MSGAGDEKVVCLDEEDPPTSPVGSLAHPERPDGLNELLPVSSKEVPEMGRFCPSPGDGEDRSVLPGKLPVMASGGRDLMHPYSSGEGPDRMAPLGAFPVRGHRTFRLSQNGKGACQMASPVKTDESSNGDPHFGSPEAVFLILLQERLHGRVFLFGCSLLKGPERPGGI